MANVRAAVVGVDVPATKIDRFTLLEQIGAGGMGVVYAAYDPKLDRKVAIKVLHVEGERASTRVLAEARALAKLSHPSVVTVYDASAAGDDLFIAMEFVTVQSLRSYLAAAPRRREELIDVLVRAGRGIAAAHAAKLVHGDIKPENVLVGASEVKVVDFGLATSVDEAPAADRHATPGTPVYMAPAQLAGAPADAASDQFSFAVMAYEVLSGARPSADAIERGSVPVIAKLSTRRMRALARALDPRAERRHPSLDALLDELVAPPSRWGRVAFAGVVATAIVVGLVLRSGRAEEPVACSSSPARLAAAWTPAQHAVVDGRIAATLDDYGRAWTAMASDVCRATRDGEQSAALLDIRMACLDRRLDELGALTASLAAHSTRSERDISRGREAAFSLSPLEPCADRNQLSGVAPPPAAVAAKVAALRTRLDRVRGMLRTSSYLAALTDANAIVDEARAIAYPPLLGEALLARGLLENNASKLDAAATTLEQAARIAASAGDDETASQAWVARVFVANQRAAFGEALAYADAAEAAATRMREPALVLAEVRAYGGDALMSEGRLTEARASYEEAVRLVEKAKGERNPLLGEVEHGLADVCSRLGDFAAASHHAERSLAIFEETLGHAHQEVALAVEELGGVAQKQGDFTKATQMYREAVELEEKYAGSDHVYLASARTNLGDMLRKAGHYPEAQIELDRARQIWEATTGLTNLDAITTLQALARLARDRGDDKKATALFEDILARRIAIHHGEIHSEVADTLNDLGNMARDAGKLDLALEHYTRALHDYEQALGPDHPSVALAQSNIGEIALIERHYDRAIEACQRALDIDEHVHGKDHPDLAYDLTCLGSAHIGLGDPAPALPLLERALALRTAEKGNPTELAGTEFVLARALVHSDPTRARALAIAARDAYAKDGKGSDDNRATVEAWLAH